MFPILALLFIVIPIVELTLLIQLGHHIDVLPTLAIIFGTGIVGAWLARNQGRMAMNTMRTRLQRGELPGDDILDGLLILIAAIVLITPGLLTDATGMLLLVPPVRAIVRKRLKRWFKTQMATGAWHVHSPHGGPAWFGGAPGDRGGPFGDDVIDITAEPKEDAPQEHDENKRPMLPPR